jgi:NAD(P)-dependent dehydrogenase (short-subunit alcohol dehydrogenase family)
MALSDDFVGRSALVVGGTSGIGAAIAGHLHDLGADVVAAGLTSSGASPQGIRVEPLDLLRGDELEALVGRTSRLDILVNCAGVIRRELEYDPEVFRMVLEVNLVGTMRACVACHRLLQASSGCVVNIASMLSFFGGPRAPAYSASKGGVAQLTRSLAVAYAPEGIRVNAVAPGWVRTELTGALQHDDSASRRIVDRTPLGRWGHPSDIVGAVAFLASPAAAFITGVVLPVDGGYHVA